MTEESLKNLFAETINIINRYGNCLLKDPKVSAREWKDLSSFMMYICDESSIHEATLRKTKIFKEELLPTLCEPENFDDERIMFQYQCELQLGYEKMAFGKQNDIYKEFENSILRKIPRKQVTNDITAVSENVNLIDPITKLPLTDPVKNSVCGHVYEKATIMQLLNTKEIIKCPIPGCVAATNIMKKDLIPYTTLKMHLAEQR